MAVSGLVLLNCSTSSDWSQSVAWVSESQMYSTVSKATYLSMQKIDVKNPRQKNERLDLLNPKKGFWEDITGINISQYSEKDSNPNN